MATAAAYHSGAVSFLRRIASSLSENDIDAMLRHWNGLPLLEGQRIPEGCENIPVYEAYVGVVVFHPSSFRVLFVRDSEKPTPTFPGGGWEHSYHEGDNGVFILDSGVRWTAWRELLEETGLWAQPKEFQFLGALFTDDERHPGAAHARVFFSCNFSEDTILHIMPNGPSVLPHFFFEVTPRDGEVALSFSTKGFLEELPSYCEEQITHNMRSQLLSTHQRGLEMFAQKQEWMKMDELCR